MEQLKELYTRVVLFGEERDTRTGPVKSLWKDSLRFDLREGFPAVTSKKLPWLTCVGELLWFLSGTETIGDLKFYTFGDRDADKWTIWTDDAKRWNGNNSGYVGQLYPVQWRDFNLSGFDQISNLIKNLKENPKNRDHIVMAWNPSAIDKDLMCLKPCHLGFQCYVTNDGHLNLHWWQRSVDCFLGLPMNIASYALLTHLLAAWTGLKPGLLTTDLGDVHIYENHFKQVGEYINNREHPLPRLRLPELAAQNLEGALHCTALDFKKSLCGYWHEGAIKAPLSVGE